MSCAFALEKSKGRFASALAFFSLLRRGRTRRRAGSAKGKGRALGNAPGKAKAEKPLKATGRIPKGALTHCLRQRTCALPGAAPVLAIRGIPPGGWGQRPQSSVLAARWPHRDETNRFRKKPLRRRREGPFFPFIGSAKRSFCGTGSVSTGARIRPRRRGFRAASLPPRRGVLGQPRPGTREADASGGISPWWSRVCLFWPSGGPQSREKERRRTKGRGERKKA